ncbi:MAG: PD-(D/E)XK nuclease family protein [Bacteroidetes bacterium]|nr:PD-(D/E)XK nuclease family protein [Bacteroidota bacterium]
MVSGYRTKRKSDNASFPQRLVELVSESNFIKFFNVLTEPNFFKIVGRTHYERWHSCFWGWLLDPKGSHLLYDYVLTRILLLTFDEKCLKSSFHFSNPLTKILPTVEFSDIEVSPNENRSTELSVKDLGRFDIFLTGDLKNKVEIKRRLNVIFEMKIDSQINAEQSKKYADWLFREHPNDINLLIYFLPRLLSDSKSTVGDERWYCMDFQLLNDKALLPILEHPNLNGKVQPFIIQYIKNLKTRQKGIKMAITNEEKKLALDLYEKYSDVFDSIFDALQAGGVIEYSTSDIPTRGRKTGRIAVKINNQIFEGDMVRTVFRKILIYLVDSGLIKKMPLPWGVGNTRYILTIENPPKHPNGRDFFYPENYKDYAIETHYGRERALAVLDSICKKLEIEFELIVI